MPAPTQINATKLSRLVGTPAAPIVVDCRTTVDCATDPRPVPGAMKLAHRSAETWALPAPGRRVVVAFQKGRKLSQGAAAWLRRRGVEAETLEGGLEASRAVKLPLVRADAMPPRDAAGRTVWVTRARPKIDRIASPGSSGVSSIRRRPTCSRSCPAPRACFATTSLSSTR